MFGIICSTAVVLFIIFCIFEPYFDYVEIDGNIWVILWYTNIKYLFLHQYTKREWIRIIKVK